jgi:hypothetical protein
MSRFHVVLFGLRVSDWAKATRQMRAKVNDRDDYQLSGVQRIKINFDFMRAVWSQQMPPSGAARWRQSPVSRQPQTHL